MQPAIDASSFARARPNTAARWARALTRRSEQRESGIFALVFVVVLVGWLGLTGYGTYLASRATGTGYALADAFYGPFTFLAPQDGYRTAATDMENDALRIGRFFGAALPVLTLLWAALHWSRARLGRWLLSRYAAGHVVILARDGFADELAKQSSRDGDCVALLEANVEAARAGDLARAGVILVPEEASVSGWLQRARAGHAAHVAAWSREDSLSLADAMAVAKRLAATGDEVVVHLQTPETQRALRHAPTLLDGEGARLRPLSPNLAALRRSLANASLVDDALALGRPSVAVRLHGSSVALQIAATLVLRQCWSMHLGPPQVSADPDQPEWARWLQHQASFLANLDRVFPGGQRPQIGSDTSGPVTRHLIDLGDDDRTLAAAFDLASRLAQAEASPPKVQPLLRNAEAAGLVREANPALRFAEPILLENTRSLSALLAREEDATAAALHLDYVAKFGGVGVPAGKPWQALGETYLHASRAAADHRSVKYGDIDRARAAGVEEAEMIERLTRTEHLRWSAERLLDGWAPGDRDNARLLHNNLVPWDALSQIDRDKDREQVLLAVRARDEAEGAGSPLPAREGSGVGARR